MRLLPFLALLAVAVPAPAAELLAVLPLESKGAPQDPALRETLEEALRTVAGDFVTAHGYTVLTGDTTLSLLQENGVDLEKACDASCHLSTARELKARVFLSGSLAKVEGAYVAFVRLFEAQGGRQLASAELDGQTVRELRQKFRDKAPQFFRPLTKGADPLANVVAAAQALLTVETTPAGALVAVDAKPVGASPAVARIVPGTHVVEVSLEGRLTQTRRLDAQAGEEPVLRIDLPPAPPPATPWYLQQPALLAGAGVVFVGGGALDYVLARDGSDGVVEFAPVLLYLGSVALGVYGMTQ